MLRRSNKYKYKTIKYFEDMPKPQRGEVIIVPMDNRIMEFAPYLATKLPKWWTDLPKEKGSIRRCQGTYDFISAGIIMPLWTDVTIRPDSSGKRLEYKCPSLVETHEYQIQSFGAEATKGCPMEDMRIMKDAQYPKLVSPWRFRTRKGISLMVLPILHDHNPNYQIVSGVVHTDTYSQIHIVINVLTDKEFVIPAGTPMQHMIPFKRVEDTKKIIFGNESMYKFWAQTGLGKGGLVQEDSHTHYRRVQKQMENEVAEYEDSSIMKKVIKKWKKK